MEPGRTRIRSLIVGAAVAATAALALSGCTGGTQPESANTLRIQQPGVSAYTANFNPLSPNALLPAKSVIYEPLMIFNPVKNENVPWLAESWEWSADNSALTFDIRDDVKWSDGEPLTAEDAAYTFELNREVYGDSYLPFVASVDATENTVTYHLSEPYSPALNKIGDELVLPEHIWKDVDNPGEWTNEKPVGSGPFTEVTYFQTSSFRIEKNPHYWQKGKPAVDAIEVIGFPSNDAANLAASNGETDWGIGYFPDVQKNFVDKDPEHRYSWNPPTGAMVQLTLNTTVPPFDDVTVRKAISMAIDREQVVGIGMSGFAVPADCTGLSGAYETWKNQQVLDSCDWTMHDPKAAAAMLDAAGYKVGADGVRVTPSGERMSYEFLVSSGASDWVASAQIVSKNLAEIGIDAPLSPTDYRQVDSRAQNGDYEIAWTTGPNGATPYDYYRGALSCEATAPVGERTLQNFQRFCSPEADKLLTQFASSFDEAGQHAAADALQRVYSDNAPIIPLFPGPNWGGYNSIRFTGWPTEENPYATLDWGNQTALIVLTSLEPAAS